MGQTERYWHRAARRISTLGKGLGLAVATLMLASAAGALEMGALKGAVYGSGNRNLVVFLHGDSGPGYMDRFAASVAQRAPGTTTVALTRPAFAGATGRSPGQNPDRDHYTRSNNKALADSLATMKRAVGAANLIVVGHSGGSAQLGTVIGKYPGIVDVAILAACPCDVPNWRKHRRGNNSWTQSESPHTFARKVSRATRVIAVTGSRDDNTLPRFAESYIGLARQAGVPAQMIVQSGATHDWSSLQGTVDAVLRQTLR
ncbi:alpha/beta hydrolase [Thalassococcus profundi]|mgnify:CR=1 FL=1|uniref:Alpha/beta hydrolase n=1 Tax=Thalassococcus profundi TaxID=2282382 RepID=A0A369TR00_9RHOB|nr:alpha/beta hydrolase [Thalassococcus profundi]RDD67663.1 alpha/beta hydrolase [Thalassococcus profundi]